MLDSSGNMFRLGGNEPDDNGTPIEASFTYPTRDYTGAGEKVRVDAVEIYWKLADAERNVNVRLLGTDTLATDGTAEPPQRFDISKDEQHEAKYSNFEARYVAVKQNIPAGEALDEFRGMTLYLYGRRAP
jgi:kynurenine formamidase